MRLFQAFNHFETQRYYVWPYDDILRLSVCALTLSKTHHHPARSQLYIM